METSRVTVNLLENGYIVAFGGVKEFRIKSIDIPDAPIKQDWYPNIEDYLSLRGNLLVEGMVVILNHKSARFDEKSRYHCVVTKFKMEGNLISFVGIYADGSVVHHRYDQSYMWAVEKGTKAELVESPGLALAVKQASKLVKAIKSMTEIVPDDEQAPAETPINTEDTELMKNHEEITEGKKIRDLRPFETFDLFGVEHVITDVNGYQLTALPRVIPKGDQRNRYVTLHLNPSTRIKVLDRLV